MTGGYRIGRVEESDLPAWWDLRLLALQTSPAAFGSDYETAKLAGPSYAERGYFGGGTNALFAAWDEGGELVAQSATFADTGKRSHIGSVISVFTHPRHRQQGLARALVLTAVAHLQQFPEIESIRISVNSSNEIARRTYEQIGFVTWGEEPDAIRTADGSCHNECHMVLRPRS